MVRESLRLLDTTQDGESACFSRTVWGKGGSLAERAGGLIVNGTGKGLPGSTDEGLATDGSAIDSRRPAGPQQVHPDQDDRDQEQDPSNHAPGFHHHNGSGLAG